MQASITPTITMALLFTLTAQELQKYTGTFDIEGYSVTVTFFIKDNVLKAQVAGESESELVPIAPQTFSVKNVQGYKIQFDINGG
jgi:hypothetical protein